MTKKLFFLKRFTSVMLVLCLILPIVSTTLTANAKAKTSQVKFSYSTKSSSKTYKSGIKAKTYYKRAVLKGNSKGVKKINKYLKKQSTDFLKSKSVKDLHSCAKNGVPYSENEEYLCYTTSKVTYNSKNIISIRLTYNWYAGGVFNSDRYGYTFNVKTGKKLIFTNVSKYSSKKAINTLYNKIIKEDPNAELKKKDLKASKLNFYLKPSYKAVVCFGPYEVGAGGWFRSYTLKSKYK